MLSIQIFLSLKNTSSQLCKIFNLNLQKYIQQENVVRGDIFETVAYSVVTENPHIFLLYTAFGYQ